jgi:hypothetical protein
VSRRRYAPYTHTSHVRTCYLLINQAYVTNILIDAFVQLRLWLRLNEFCTNSFQVFLICRLPVILQRTCTRGLYYLRGARDYALTRSVGLNKVVLVRETSSLNEVLLNVSNLFMLKGFPLLNSETPPTRARFIYS